MSKKTFVRIWLCLCLSFAAAATADPDIVKSLDGGTTVVSERLFYPHIPGDKPLHPPGWLPASRQPEFPDADEIKTITRRRSADLYPRLSIHGGGALRFIDDTGLERVFGEVESSLGAYHWGSFRKELTSFMLGMRLHFHRRVALLWEWVFGGSPEVNQVRISMIGVSLMYTLYIDSGNNLAASVGAGVASQDLKAYRKYNIKLEDEGTLEEISFSTGQRTAVPIIFMLELPGMAASRYGLYFSARYIIADDFNRKLQGWDPNADIDVDATVQMDGYLFGAGVVIRF